MKLAAPLVVLGLIAVSPTLAAAPSIGYVDLFAVPDAKLDSGDAFPQLKGDGYGIKGGVTFADRYFAAGEYQDVDYDDLVGDFDGDDVDDEIGTALKQFRVGLGMRLPLGSSTLVFSQAEYVNVKSEADVTLSNGGDALTDSDSVDDDGYGIHLGVRGENGRLGVTAKLGYLDVGDVDGAEYEIEADYRVWEIIGLFANYRWSDLGGEGFENELKDFRVGATIYLGSQAN